MRDALCAEYPNAWWFPDQGSKLGDKAKAVCGRCLVRAELGHAFTDPNAREHGIWAGTTPAERRTLKRAAA